VKLTNVEKCRPAPANGIKLNTACFPLSRSIGAESRYASFKTMVQLIAATTHNRTHVRAELMKTNIQGHEISMPNWPPSSSCVMPSTVTEYTISTTMT